MEKTRGVSEKWKVKSEESDGLSEEGKVKSEESDGLSEEGKVKREESDGLSEEGKVKSEESVGSEKWRGKSEESNCFASVSFICSTNSLLCTTIHTHGFFTFNFSLFSSLAFNFSLFTTSARSIVFPVPVGICTITDRYDLKAVSIRSIISLW